MKEKKSLGSGTAVAMQQRHPAFYRTQGLGYIADMAPIVIGLGEGAERAFHQRQAGLGFLQND